MNEFKELKEVHEQNKTDESNKKVGYWIKLADYDYETAKAMLNTGRYLYVGFMCHQVIEKALKAVISRD